jgi:hypothetical protein
MSNRVLYEGYVIQSSPRYLAEWEQWQLCIFISFQQHGAMKPREFSSEVLYPTKQEADIHGIAFGQKLIDGKVEGCSVTDMRVEKRHGIRRFYVQFPTTISDHAKHDGSGLIRDLSLGGCQLESQWSMTPGITLKLQVQVPGLESPLVIDGAHVQWVRGQFVGLAFVRIRKTEQQRLERVIADLRIRGVDEAH